MSFGHLERLLGAVCHHLFFRLSGETRRRKLYICRHGACVALVVWLLLWSVLEGAVILASLLVDHGGLPRELRRLLHGSDRGLVCVEVLGAPLGLPWLWDVAEWRVFRLYLVHRSGVFEVLGGHLEICRLLGPLDESHRGVFLDYVGGEIVLLGVVDLECCERSPDLLDVVEVLEIGVRPSLIVLLVLHDDLLGNGVLSIDAFRLQLLEVLRDGG